MLALSGSFTERGVHAMTARVDESHGGGGLLEDEVDSELERIPLFCWKVSPWLFGWVVVLSGVLLLTVRCIHVNVV